MKYISNAFSPKMLNPKTNPNFIIKETTLNEINKNRKDLISAIGHDDISRHLHIKKNRINIQLEKYDILYIVQKSMENNNEYRVSDKSPPFSNKKLSKFLYADTLS